MAQRIIGVAHRMNLEAVFGQDLHEQIADQELVLDHKHLRARRRIAGHGSPPQIEHWSNVD
jgi:hypothetical protein